MQLSIKPVSGQSNYDICLQSVGGLDGFVNMLTSNGITSSSFVPSKVSYNTNDVLSKVIAGRVYCTGTNLITYLTDNGTPISDNGTPLTDN